ncbi:MAG: nitroreductase family protein [Paludibacteraceae bacterium]
MMFSELAEKRYSLRQFDATRAVEQAKIDYLLQCARLAPSAVNLQPYRFYVVTDRRRLNDLCTCYQREWFAAAPLCVVACADHTQSWHRPNDGKDHADIDVAIAVDHLTLAAAEVGLGSCWVCNFDAKRCAELLQLPSHIEPVVLVPIGYAVADTVIPSKKRKSATDLFACL